MSPPKLWEHNSLPALLAAWDFVTSHLDVDQTLFLTGFRPVQCTHSVCLLPGIMEQRRGEGQGASPAESSQKQFLPQHRDRDRERL